MHTNLCLQYNYQWKNEWFFILGAGFSVSTHNKCICLYYVVFVVKISSQFSQIISYQRATLQNFNSWMIKMTKIPILPNYQVPYSLLYLYVVFKCYHSRIEIMQNYSAVLFLVSLVRENLRGSRKNLKHKKQT